LNVPPTGFTGLLTANAGSMETQGLEFDLATLNIDTKDFKWRTSINVE
jgi:hypothetical protein